MLSQLSLLFNSTVASMSSKTSVLLVTLHPKRLHIFWISTKKHFETVFEQKSEFRLLLRRWTVAGWFLCSFYRIIWCYSMCEHRWNGKTLVQKIATPDTLCWSLRRFNCFFMVMSAIHPRINRLQWTFCGISFAFRRYTW